jgi:hypothetical protein
MASDRKDAAGGAALALFGMVFAGEAALNSPIGTLQQIGPGLFPVATGLLLVGFGLAMALPALRQRAVRIEFRLRETGFALISVAAFALLIEPFGLFPATAATVFLSAAADRDYRPLNLAVLTGGLCLAAWLAFRLALGLPLVLARWPF